MGPHSRFFGKVIHNPPPRYQPRDAPPHPESRHVQPEPAPQGAKTPSHFFAKNTSTTPTVRRKTIRVRQALQNLCEERTEIICGLAAVSNRNWHFYCKDRTRHAHIGRAESVLAGHANA